MSQILHVLLGMGYLRWKFKSVSTALWSGDNGAGTMSCSRVLSDRGKMLISILWNSHSGHFGVLGLILLQNVHVLTLLDKQWRGFKWLHKYLWDVGNISKLNVNFISVVLLIIYFCLCETNLPCETEILQPVKANHMCQLSGNFGTTIGVYELLGSASPTIFFRLLLYPLWGLWLSTTNIVSCTKYWINIHILLSLMDRVGCAFKLQQLLEWQLNAFVSRLDREVVLQGGELKESTISIISDSKGRVEIEITFSLAYIVACKDEGGEINASSIARDAPLMQIYYTQVPTSKDCST